MQDSIERALGRLEANVGFIKDEQIPSLHARLDNIDGFVALYNKDKFIKKGALMILGAMSGGLGAILGIFIEIALKN